MGIQQHWEQEKERRHWQIITATKRIFFNKDFDWSLFSGMVLGKKSKRIFDAYKDFLNKN